MGKSKAQRKQDKRALMQEKGQEIKDVTEKEQGQEIKKEEAKEIKAKEPEKKTVGPEQVKLTMYTLVAMIVTFISAGVVAMAMIVYAKPIIYVLETTVGSTFNTYSHEAVEQLMFENNPDLPIYGLYLGVAGLVAVVAVVTLVGMIRAVNEFNKPNIVLAIIGLVFSVGGLVLFLYADDYTKDIIKSYGFQEEPMFNIYSLYLPLLITNICAMVCNIIATANGLKRWKKTGRTSK